MWTTYRPMALRACARRPSLAFVSLLALAGMPARAGAASGAVRIAQDVAIAREWSRTDYRELTGDWGGLRSDLAERGVVAKAFNTVDVFSVVDGGVHRRTSLLGDFDLVVTLDGEALLGWSGTSALLYGLGTYGDNPSDDAGDSQGLDNIAAPAQLRLFEAWLLQEVLDGRFSVLLGLYDVNGEFDVNEVGAVLVNSAFGTGTDLAQSGRNGPSIFPVSGLAARVRASDGERLYAQVAVVDGVPGNPDDPYGTQLSLRSSDGAFVVAEAGAHLAHEPGENDPSWRLAAGGWFYTTSVDRISTEDPPRTGRGSHGAYAMAEGALWRQDSRPERGLGGFVRVGYANPQYDPFEWFVGAGLVYTGPTASRPDDQVAFGVAAAIAGSPTLRAASDAGQSLFGAEVALEWTYRLHATPWLALQPDVQYIVHPGLDRGLRNAVALGLRVEVAL